MAAGVDLVFATRRKIPGGGAGSTNPEQDGQMMALSPKQPMLHGA